MTPHTPKSNTLGRNRPARGAVSSRRTFCSHAKPQPVQARSNFLNVFVATYPAAADSESTAASSATQQPIPTVTITATTTATMVTSISRRRSSNWIRISTAGQTARRSARPLGLAMHRPCKARPGAAPATPVPTAPTRHTPPTNSIAWNDLGMHCVDDKLRCLFDPAALQQPVGAARGPTQRRRRAAGANPGRDSGVSLRQQQHLSEQNQFRDYETALWSYVTTHRSDR